MYSPGLEPADPVGFIVTNNWNAVRMAEAITKLNANVEDDTFGEVKAPGKGSTTIARIKCSASTLDGTLGKQRDKWPFRRRRTSLRR